MIGIAVLIFFLAVVCVAAAIAGKFAKPLDRTPSEMASIIRAFVNGSGGRHDWDDFICGGAIRDPKLEAIRARCASLPGEFPPATSGYYCGPEGMAVLRQFAVDLERGAGNA